MNKQLTYRGYLGSIEADLDNNSLYGQALFLQDSVYYQGTTLDELRNSFEEAVDEYLETCQEMGKEPEKTFSGSFNIRISPHLHRELAYKAAQMDVSINAAIAKAVENFVAPKPSEVKRYRA